MTEQPLVYVGTGWLFATVLLATLASLATIVGALAGAFLYHRARSGLSPMPAMPRLRAQAKSEEPAKPKPLPTSKG